MFETPKRQFSALQWTLTKRRGALGTYRHRLVRARTAGAVCERYDSGAVGTWFHLDDSAVADRNPEYVMSQVP